MGTADGKKVGAIPDASVEVAETDGRYDGTVYKFIVGNVVGDSVGANGGIV